MATDSSKAIAKEASVVSSKFLVTAGKLPPLLLSTILFEFLLFWIVIASLIAKSPTLGYCGAISMVIVFMVITIMHMSLGGGDDVQLRRGQAIRARKILPRDTAA